MKLDSLVHVLVSRGCTDSLIKGVDVHTMLGTCAGGAIQYMMMTFTFYALGLGRVGT